MIKLYNTIMCIIHIFVEMQKAFASAIEALIIWTLLFSNISTKSKLLSK